MTFLINRIELIRNFYTSCIPLFCVHLNTFLIKASFNFFLQFSLGIKTRNLSIYIIFYKSLRENNEKEIRVSI